MTYEQAIEEAACTCVDASDALTKALDLAKAADSAPVPELKDLARRLKAIAADVESLADNDCTVAQMSALRSLYEGERRAGLHQEHTQEGMEMRLREMRGLE